MFNKEVVTEICILVFLGIIIFLISGQLDLLEELFILSRKYESYELDELIVTGVLLLFAMVPLLIRRWVNCYKQTDELKRTMAELQQLKTLLPICSCCKDLKDDSKGWVSFENYIKLNTQAEFTHGICPKCIQKLYPNSRLAKKKSKSEA